ncbi:MAG: protein-glutamate O-methyltransferase CheR [Spirochaetota bacterium]|jgi:chemotaxis protein methyltransferase CheR
MKIKDEQLTDDLFKKFVNLFYELAGISLKDYKKYLVEYRLCKIVGPDKEFKNYEDLYLALLNDIKGDLRIQFVNLLTTNYTYFFREEYHFDFVKEYVKQNYTIQPYMRLWSAGCSTGEEAYSMAIMCHEALGNSIYNYDIKILATDISLNVLQFASEGVYHYSKIRGNIEDHLLKRYFYFDKEKKTFTVKNEIKNSVQVRFLNLMDDYPFKRLFDIVFLRNVLIYFDNNEKEIILSKMYDYIKPGGYLILGLSESLVGIRHNFYQLPHSVYQKHV